MGFSVLFIPVGSCLWLPRAIAEFQKHEWDKKNQWQEFIFPSEHSPNPSPKLRRDLSLSAHPAGSKYSIHIHGSDSQAELCLATTRLEKVLFHQGRFLFFFFTFQILGTKADSCTSVRKLQQASGSSQAPGSAFISLSSQKKHDSLDVPEAPELTEEPRQKQN